MLGPTTPALEIVARVVCVYVALLVMVRVSGKREVGQLGPIDLLAMLILSETVSPVLTAQDETLGGGLIAAATLLALGATVGRLTWWSPRFERLVDGEPVVLIENGRVHEGAERAERITAAELAQALRSAGVEELADVKLAVVEVNGEITIVPKK
jgi:uncharacterized membrane protein YcaP (DUF421 family)